MHPARSHSPHHLKRVAEENLSSFAGLVIKRYGDLETFKRELLFLSADLEGILHFYETIGLRNGADVPALADRIISEQRQGKNILIQSIQSYATVRVSDHVDNSLYNKFLGERIADRNRLAEITGDDVENYAEFLPCDIVEKERVVEHAREIYSHIILPIAAMSDDLSGINQNISQALEHRADYHAASKIGANETYEMLNILLQVHETERALVPAALRVKHDRDAAYEHPHPSARLDFIEKRFMISPDLKTRLKLSDTKVTRPERPGAMAEAASSLIMT